MATRAHASRALVSDEATMPTRSGQLRGMLNVPANATGLVMFAHGSGSSRLSPRNRFVAGALQQRGLGTLLFDLLTAREDRVDEATAEHRFDIPLLAERLGSATDWVAADSRTGHLRIGYFGASTGAAAALAAAAQRTDVAAVVSRGGRPDLAGDALPLVRAPTLLIVGARDGGVVQLNREALGRLERSAHCELVLVPRATHLFEEAGALDEVARLAGEWFEEFLGGPGPGHAA